MRLIKLTVLILLASHVKAYADTEIWGLEDVGKDKIKIELNVDGCITSFTLPKKKLDKEGKVMDSMLSTAENRQKLGCK